MTRRPLLLLAVVLAALVVVGLGGGCCTPLAARQEAAGRLHEALLRARESWSVYRAATVPHPAYGPDERAAVENNAADHEKALSAALELAAELDAAEGDR